MDGVSRLSLGTPGIVSGMKWKIVSTGDFNGDGKSDILWRHSSTGKVIIWLMGGISKSSFSSPGTVTTLWKIK